MNFKVVMFKHENYVAARVVTLSLNLPIVLHEGSNLYLNYTETYTIHWYMLLCV